MSEWVDYYTVLGVPQGADTDEIKRVYRFKSQTYHPDKVHPSHRDLAEREFIAFTAAYETLIDPDKRKIYDLEWEQRTGNRSASQGLPPKPEITPRSIRFADANAGEPGTASFVVDNSGGACSHISISNPDSWLKVTDIVGLSQTDELPLQVNLEAVGGECGKTYTETIFVKLDEVAVPVNIELHTLAKQSRIKKAIASASPRYRRILAFPREWRGQLTGAGASTLAGGLLILYCALGGFVGFQAIIILLALSLIGLSVSSTVMTDWLRNKTKASGTLRFAANTSVVCGWISIGATAVYAAVYAVILIFWVAVWLIAIAAVIGIICAMFSSS